MYPRHKNTELLSHADPPPRCSREGNSEAFVRPPLRGVEPILGKGWAIARLYPERGMRPYGDIDLASILTISKRLSSDEGP